MTAEINATRAVVVAGHQVGGDAGRHLDRTFPAFTRSRGLAPAALPSWNSWQRRDRAAGRSSWLVTRSPGAHQGGCRFLRFYRACSA